MPRTLSALGHELVGLGSDCVAASGASGVVLILCRMSRVAKAFQMAVARRGDLHLFWLALRVVETRDVADRCGPLQELHAVVALERSLVPQLMDGGATCMALLGALKATVEHDARFPRHGPRHGQYASETSETFRARVVAAEVLSLMLGHSDGKVRDVLGGKGLSNELCEAAIGLLSELRQTQRMQFFLGPLHFEEWAELKQALKCAAYLACRSCDVGRPHGEQPAYPERTTRQYTLLQEGLAVATAYAAHLQLGLWRCGDEYWPRYGRNIEARPVSTRTRNSQRRVPRHL